MIDIELFHFLRPHWFIALLPLVLLLWFLFFRKGAQSNWETVVDEPLLPHILSKGASGPRRAALLLSAGAGLLGILALAGPVWEKLPQPVFTTQEALVIALDLTRSMDANDISPSRLQRARYKISDLLEQRQEGQTALLVYAGDAFTVTPLTDDVETIRAQLNALDTGIMPATGNRTDKAITLALDLLRQGGMEHGQVLLITDEVNPDLAGASVARLRGEGYRLSVLGVGTQHGAPVLLPDGGFLQGRDGAIVLPILAEDELRELAGAGGGMYVRVSKDDADVERLNQFFAGAQPQGEQAGAEISADVWREQGPWLVLCLLPLAALLFRRGYVLGLLLLPLADTAQALDWERLWLRQDQQAQRAMAAQDYTGAAVLFDDPAWKAAAQHRAGDYQGAVDSLEPLVDAQSSYNRGNALARLGRYPEAIAAYQHTLAAQPEHADAKFNKELLEQALKQQQQQQQQQGEQEQDAQPEQQQPHEQEAGDGGEQHTEGGQQQQAENEARQQPDQPQQEAAEQNEASAADQEQQQEERRQQGEQAQQQARQQDAEQALAQAQAAEQKTAEQQQATEQWLRRIPDDPSALLRRKFRYQYQQREYEESRDDQTW